MNKQHLISMAGALLASVALASCATSITGTTGAAETEQERVDRLFADGCLGVRLAHTGFNTAVAITDKIPADVIAWEEKVMVAVMEVCNGPPPDVENWKTVSIWLADRAVEISEVMKRARSDE